VTLVLMTNLVIKTRVMLFSKLLYIYIYINAWIFNGTCMTIAITSTVSTIFFLSKLKW